MPLTPEAFFRALSDLTRLRCLLLLAEHDELCVCELMHAVHETQPKVSRHLATLRETGIVLDRRDGLWIHYRVNPQLPAWARQVLATTARASAGTEPHARDRQRLATMPARPPSRCPA
jgi:ArsR family transcriptional regulator